MRVLERRLHAAVAPLTLDQYDRLRSEPTQFAVALGHESPEIEEVVFVADTYQVVRKQGEAAAIAENRDPRDG